MTRIEMNFDGLVGPTHNYAGLSYGNVASATHARKVANPREAALQGLDKARTLAALGMHQGILPPHERPHMPTLKRLGFTGSDSEIIGKAWKAAPSYLLAASSASPMWTANAGTISSSAETADGRVHMTAANLCAMPHRGIEHPVTARALQAIFNNDAHFCVHQALPSIPAYGDEGAANHTRFEGTDGNGVDFFVYGASAFSRTPYKPARFPARQTLEASETIARIHGLSAARTVYAQQNPDYIDAGVFHNDVIAVGARDTLFCYEDAFVDTSATIAEIDEKLAGGLKAVIVPTDAVPLADVIKSYLFNSQLLAIPGTDGLTLILPKESEEIETVRRYLDELMAGNGPIRHIRFFDLRQSMQNGGGPACLRLRVPLNAAERAAVNPGAVLDDRLYEALTGWVRRHYRDRMVADDISDPQLLVECRTALDELTQIMALGSIYDFQRG